MTGKRLKKVTVSLMPVAVITYALMIYYTESPK